MDNAIISYEVRFDGPHPEDISPSSEHDVASFGARVDVLTVFCFHFIGTLHELVEAVVP